MSHKRIKRKAAFVLMTLVIAGGLAAVVCSFQRQVQVRGALSRADLAEITGAHLSYCPEVWPKLYPKWFPMSVRQYLSAVLNPIEIIAVPKPGEAIVVYRGFHNFYYNRTGKHRWGTESYTLKKDNNGWHLAWILP